MKKHLNLAKFILPLVLLIAVAGFSSPGEKQAPQKMTQYRIQAEIQVGDDHKISSGLTTRENSRGRMAMRASDNNNYRFSFRPRKNIVHHENEKSVLIEFEGKLVFNGDTYETDGELFAPFGETVEVTLGSMKSSEEMILKIVVDKK